LVCRRGFALDRAVLDTRWRALQAEVHPDRFAADGASAQRVAMQWSVRVNEAYRRLKDPLARAPTCANCAARRCAPRTTPRCRPIS
jgi:Fe-S protein assembly co-chaperone HscB